MGSLLDAAHSGDVEMVRALLADSATDPNATDEKGCTALHAAASCDEVGVIELLLADSRTDTAARARFGMNPLHQAAASNAVGALAALLAHVELEQVNAPNEWGESPLHLASAAGHRSAVRLLLSHGAEPERVDRWGRTAWHVAAESGITHPELLGLPRHVPHTLDPTTLVHPPPEDGSAAGPDAAKQAAQREEVVRRLALGTGVGVGLLHPAGHTRRATTSISAQAAAASAPDGSGAGVAAVAPRAAESRPALSKWCEFPGDEAEIGRLLESGEVQPAGRDLFGLSALHKFSSWDRVELIELLLPRLQQGEVNLRAGPANARGTPLHLAAESGAVRAVDVLLRQPGVDPLARDDKGRTPRDVALREGHVAIADRLP
jgi:ankyrin repeat protein